MKAIDLKELNLNNLAIWPMPIKIGVIACCCLLILVIGYLFDTSSQLTQLNNAKQQESVLQMTFQTKQSQASSLLLYKKQLVQIQQVLAGMVMQLPNSTEIPNLLESITKVGVANGLQFHLFKPLPENAQGVFIELPIQISVVGSYHELGAFITQIAGLSRIVTLQNFSIAPYKSPQGGATQQAQESVGPVDDRLQMDITATTYRYDTNASEVNKTTTTSKKQ